MESTASSRGGNLLFGAKISIMRKVVTQGKSEKFMPFFLQMGRFLSVSDAVTGFPDSGPAPVPVSPATSQAVIVAVKLHLVP